MCSVYWWNTVYKRKGVIQMLALIVPTKKELSTVLEHIASSLDIQKLCATASATQLREGIQVQFLGRTIVLCVCGVGPVASAIATTALSARYSAITAIVHCGIAGAYDVDRCPLGTTVLVTTEQYGEYGIRTADGISRAFAFLQSEDPFVDFSCDTTPIMDWARIAQCDVNTIAMLPAVQSMTLAGVSGDRSTARRVQGSTAVENMEGFGVVFAAKVCNIPIIELRSIANAVGDRVHWNIARALYSLANVIRSLLSYS